MHLDSGQGDGRITARNHASRVAACVQAELQVALVYLAVSAPRLPLCSRNLRSQARKAQSSAECSVALYIVVMSKEARSEKGEDDGSRL